MKYALLTMIAALAGLASAPLLRADGAPPRPAGDRGFRDAEAVLAAVTDVSRTVSRYRRRVAGQAWNGACRENEGCSYDKQFGISLGRRTIVALHIMLRFPGSARTVCGDRRPGRTCAIAASVYLADDEAFPHCVGVDRLRRAAIRNGWRLAPYRHAPDDPNVSRYRRDDDVDLFLFIRTTTNDARCFRHLNIQRIPAIRVSAR